MPIGTEILTTAQMRAIETAAMSSGEVTGRQLMERAGAAVAGQIRLRWPKPGRVLVLCGPGNNGGDGYVIARLLDRAGWRVRVMGCETPAGADAGAMKAAWLRTGPILPFDSDGLAGHDLFVDAIFGTGLTRPPEGQIAAVLNCLGRDPGFFRPRLVAVDCPSGLCMDSGVVLGGGDDHPHATLTVAFDSPKPGHLLARGPTLCGDLVIADIGLRRWREGAAPLISLAALWPDFPVADGRVAPGLSGLLKHSASQPHKFSHGHAVIVAGGAGHGGAARLSARGALRIGAGLVTLAPPSDAMQEHSTPPDALMRRPVDGADDLCAVLDDRRIGALCLGPGCGVDRAGALLPAVLASGRAAVLDADALTALSGYQHPPALHDRCVLTPHGGEFARLFPDIAERLSPDAPVLRGPAFSRLDAARQAAARSGAVVLLKGADTVIAAPDGRARIHSAFDIPWLATAGSGDVLAGIVTGLLARGFPALEAASLGTLLHAFSAREFGPGLIADDLPEMLPRVIRAMTGTAAAR